MIELFKTSEQFKVRNLIVSTYIDQNVLAIRVKPSSTSLPCSATWAVINLSQHKPQDRRLGLLSMSQFLGIENWQFLGSRTSRVENSEESRKKESRKHTFPFDYKVLRRFLTYSLWVHLDVDLKKQPVQRSLVRNSTWAAYAVYIFKTFLWDCTHTRSKCKEQIFYERL